MATRTVQVAIATYTDENGARRIGQAGEVVNVHPDDLARFAEVNGIVEVQAPSKPAPKKAPRKRAAPRKR